MPLPISLHSQLNISWNILLIYFAVNINSSSAQHITVNTILNTTLAFFLLVHMLALNKELKAFRCTTSECLKCNTYNFLNTLWQNLRILKDEIRQINSIIFTTRGPQFWLCQEVKTKKLWKQIRRFYCLYKK